MTKTIALIGEYDPDIVAHVAIPKALELARARTGSVVEWKWMETGAVKDPRVSLGAVAGVWVAPANNYADPVGVLEAIRYARENDLPFLGTCGGFQNSLIEFARNVVGIKDADHAETNPGGTNLIVTRLACSLVGKNGEIVFSPGSRLAAIFENKPSLEGYHCNYGVNAEFRERLESKGLRFTGFDAAGEIRAAELPSNRFFVGTLFQPERSSATGRSHPLIESFVSAVAR